MFNQTKIFIMDFCCLFSLWFSSLVSTTCIYNYGSYKNKIEKNIFAIQIKYNKVCNPKTNILNNQIHLPNLQNSTFLLASEWCDHWLK